MEILSGSCLMWLAVAGGAAAIEAASCCMVSAWFVLGALVSCVAAAAGAGAAWQVAIFLLASAAGALALRPLVLRGRRRPGSAEPSMVGQTVVVTASPTPASPGRAKDSRGMDWAIVVDAAGESCVQRGEHAVVVEQRSATLVVEPAGR